MPLVLLLPIPSLFQHSLCPMKCPTMVTTELSSTPFWGGGGRYFWIGSFKGGASVGFRPFDSVSVRFARLIMILGLVWEERERVRYGSLTWPWRMMTVV